MSLVNLYTSVEGDLSNPRIFPFDIDMPASAIIKQIALNFNLAFDQEYKLNVTLGVGNTVSIIGDQTLSSIGIQSGNSIQIAGKDKPLQPEIPAQGTEQVSIGGLPIIPGFDPASMQTSTFGGVPLQTGSLGALALQSGNLNGLPSSFDPSALQTGVSNLSTMAPGQAPGQLSPTELSQLSTMSQFNTVSQFNPANADAPQVDLCIPGMQFGDFTEELSLFDATKSVKVGRDKDKKQNQSERTTRYMLENGIVIEEAITDEITRNDFGNLKWKDDGIEKMMIAGNVQTYEVLTFDAFKPDKEPVMIKFCQTLDYNDTRNLVMTHLGLEEGYRYSFLFISSLGTKFWLREGTSLERFQFTEETDLYVYHRDMKVKIFTAHYPPRMCTLDAEATVKATVLKLAESFGITNPYCYTLVAREEDTDYALNPSITIPEQTNCMRELALRREWFIISRVDIGTYTAAIQTYKDTKKRLFADDIGIIPETALEFAALQFFIESDKESQKHPTFPNDVSFLFPKSTTLGKKMGKQLEEYCRNYGKIDQFNAIRRFLGLVRRYPGFGVLDYDAVVVVRTKAGSFAIHALLEIGPYTLTIYEMESNVLQEKISYTSILGMKVAEQTLFLEIFIRKNLIVVYEVVCNYGNEIKMLIERYIEIMNDLMRERANKPQLLPPNRGGRKYQILLPTTDDLALDDGMRSFTYDKNMTGEILALQAEKNLRIKHNQNHIILVKYTDRNYRFCFKNDVAALFSLRDGVNIYLIDRVQLIKIHFSDGRTVDVKLDITKSITDLTADAFAAIKFPALLGFTFWIPNQAGELEPLDLRYSIPSQTPDFKEIHLLRRFYTLSGEILQGQAVAKMTLIDTLPCFTRGLCPVSDEELYEFGALYLYAMVVNKMDDVDTLRDYTFIKDILPPGKQLTPQLLENFKRFVISYPPKDKFNAMRVWLGKIRKLPNFGCESYDCQFQDITAGTNSNVHKHYAFTLAPLYILIGPKEGIPRFQIAYKYLVNFEIANSFLILSFIGDQRGTIITAKMLFKGTINTVAMLIAYNIKLINDLILAKELKKKRALQEQIRRLRGGYVDEKGKIHGPMCDFYVTKNPNQTTNLPMFWIDLNYTGEDIVKSLMKALKLKKDTEYCVLNKSPDNEYKWIGQDTILGSIAPLRCSLILILERFPTIKIIPIGAKDPRPQRLRFDASMILSQMMPGICQKFELPYVPGITLAYIDKGKTVYLDTNRSIPEQANLSNDFYIMLRLFALPSSAITDFDMLWFIYCQTKECVLRGTYKLAPNEIVTLCYYSITADTGEVPSPDKLPPDQRWVPKGFPKPPLGNIFPQLYKENGVLDNHEAMRKYIDFARSCPLFSTQVFKVEVDPEMEFRKKGKLNVLHIGTSFIDIYNEREDALLFKVPYEDILSVDSKDNMVSLRHRDQNLTPLTYCCITDKAMVIFHLIQEIQMVNQQALYNRALKAREEEDVMLEDCVLTLNTISGVFNSPGEAMIQYSTLNLGKEVAEMACEQLGLDETQGYVIAVRSCKGEFVWLEEDDLLGSTHPKEGFEIYIYYKYTRSPFYTEDGVREVVMFDIQAPLSKVIPRLGARFFVEFWNGYDLYKNWDEEKREIDVPVNCKGVMPLDLNKSIPEQCIHFDNLCFKRRFYLFTKNDVSFVDTKSYLEVKNYMLTNVTRLPEGKAVELSVYSVFAEKVDQYGNVICDFNTADDLLPTWMKATPQLRTIIQEIVATSPVLNPLASQRKYVALARSVGLFGCELFTGIFVNDETKNVEYPTVGISIGPFGFHLYDDQNKKDYCKVAFSNIINVTTIGVKLMVKVLLASGSNKTLLVYSPQAKYMCNLMEQYTKANNPVFTIREQVQGLADDPTIQKLVESRVQFSIPLRTSGFVKNPTAIVFPFNPEWQEIECVRMALFYLGIKMDRQFCILYMDNFMHFKWLDKDKILMDIQPEKIGNLYAIPAEVEVYVVPPTGPTTPINLKTRTAIRDNVAIANEVFGFGSNFGMTYYELVEDELYALDFLNPLPTETHHYLELALGRRFFIATRDMAEDDETAICMFRDFSQQVLFEENNIPLAAAIELGICQLYASCDTPEEMEGLYETLDDDVIRGALPTSIELTEDVTGMFYAAFQDHPMMEAGEAVFRYLCIASAIPDFASENYECYYTDMTDQVHAPRRPVLVMLSVPYVQVLDGETYDLITRIYYSNIISHVTQPMLCNVKFQDDNFLFHDVNFESTNIAPQIGSYINDILDLYKTIYDNHLEFLSDDSIDYAALGLSVGQDNGDNGQNGDNDAYDDCGLIQFDDFKEFRDDINEDYLRKAALEDAFYVPPDNNDFNKLRNNNNKNVKDVFGDGDLTWRANGDALDAARRRQFLDDLRDDLSNLRDGIDSSDPTALAQEFGKLKGDLDALDLDLGDSLDALNLRDCINTLFDTAQTASIAAVGLDEIADQLNKNLDGAIEASKNGSKASEDALRKIKANSKGKIDDPNARDLANTLCAMSEVEEKLAKQLGDNDETIEKLGIDPAKLADLIKLNSSALTKLAADINNGEPDASKLTKIIPDLRDCNMRIDDLNNLVKVAGASNVDLADLDDLKKKLADLAAAAERIALAGQVNDPEAKKYKKYQIYLGNHTPIEKVIQELPIEDGLVKDLINGDSIKDPETKDYLDVLSYKIPSSLDKLKKEVSALNQNPTNDLARSGAINSLHDIDDMLDDCIENLTPIEKTDKNAKKVLDEAKKIKPYIAQALLDLSTFNITPDDLSLLIEDIKAAGDALDKIPQDVQNKMAKDKLNKLKSARANLDHRRPKLIELRDALKVDPTSGELVMNTQAELKEVLKDVDNFTPESLGLAKTAGNKNLKDKTNTLYDRIHGMLDEGRGAEGVVACPHEARYRQALVEEARLINQLSKLLDDPELKDKKLKKDIQKLKDGLIELRPEEIEVKKELHNSPYNDPYIEHGLEVMDPLNKLLEKIADDSANLQEIFPDSNIQPLALVAKQVALAATDALKEASLGEFRKPPEKKAVCEIRDNVKDQIDMLNALLRAKDVGDKPVVQEELKKRIDLYNKLLDPLEVQAADPTVEYIPLAEKLKELNAKTKNLCSGINDYKQNPKYNGLLDQAESNIDFSLRKTPPNDDLAKRCFLESVQPIKQLKDVNDDLLKRPSIQANPAALKTLKDWDSNLKDALQKINKFAKLKEPTKKDFNKVKEALATVNSKMAQIPPELKGSLSDKDLSNLGRAICGSKNHSGIACSCVRKLPTTDKFEIDTSPFKPIDTTKDPTEVLHELAAQVNAMKGVIGAIEDRKDISSGKPAQALISDMNSQLGVPLKAIDPLKEDKPAIETLLKLKQNMPQFLTDSTGMTGVLNNEAFQDIAKILSDNVTRCHSIMTRPHLTPASAGKIVDEILSDLQEVFPVLEAADKAKTLQGNPEASKNLEALLRAIPNFKDNLKNMKLGDQQAAIDKLNAMTANLLNAIEKSPNVAELLDKLEPAYTLTNKYTTQARIPVKVAAHLIPKNSKDDDDRLDKAFLKALAQIDTSKMKPDDSKYIKDNLNWVKNAKKGIPWHIMRAAGVFAPLVETGKPIYGSDSARIFAAANGVPEKRKGNLAKLVVKDSLKTASLLPEMKAALDKIGEAITANPSAVSEDIMDLYAECQKDVRDADPTVLEALKSFPAAVQLYPSLHNLDDASKQLIHSPTKCKDLKEAIKDLQKVSGNKYDPWLKQIDLSMEELVNVATDGIAKNTEDILHADQLGALPESTQDALNSLLPILKSDNRDIAFCPEDLSDLAKILNDMQDKELPVIQQYAPESDEKNQIEESLKNLEEIKPVLRIWAANRLGNDNEAIRAATEETIKNVLDGLNKVIPSELKPEKIVGGSSGEAQVDHLLGQLQSVPTDNKGIKKVTDGLKKAKKDLKKQKKAKAPKLEIPRDELQSLLEDAATIAPVSLSSLLKLRRANLGKDGDNKDLVPVVKSTNQLVNAFKASLDNVQPIDEADLDGILDTAADTVAEAKVQEANKYRKMKILLRKKKGKRRRGDLKKKVGKIRRRRRKNPLHADTSRDASKEAVDKIKDKTCNHKLNDRTSEGIVKNTEMAHEMFKELMEVHQRANLVNRLISLQQQQKTMFPDIQAVKRSEKKNFGFDVNDIQNGIISIQTQLQNLNDNSKLADVQQGLTPKDILIQQSILSDASNLALTPEARLPVKSCVELVRLAELYLLDRVFINHANNPTEIELTPPAEAQRMVSRGIAAAGLLSKLRLLSNEILRNTPDIFALAKTSEGAKAMAAPLSPHEVMDIHQSIQEQLGMLSTPEKLAAYQKHVTAPKAIAEVRIITHLLDLLSGDNGTKILNDATVDANEESLMEKITLDQQLLIQKNPQEVKLPSLIDTNKCVKFEEYLLDSLARLDLIQKLSELQQEQAAISQVASEGLCNPDATQIQSAATVHKQLPSLYGQNENIDGPGNLIKLIKEMAPDDLQAQQQMILQAITIISSPDVLAKYNNAGKPTKVANKKVIGRLQDKIMERELELLFVEPDKIKSIDDGLLISPIQSMANVDYESSRAARGHDLASFMNYIAEIRPEVPISGKDAKDIVNKTLTPKNLPDFNDSIEEGAIILQTTPEDIPSYLNDYSQPEQVVLYAVSEDQLYQLNANSLLHSGKVNDLSMDQRILDHAGLMQLTPANRAKMETPDMAQVPPSIENGKKDILNTNIKDKFISLQRQRIAAAPGIVDAANIDTLDKIAPTLTAKKIKDAQDSLLSQIDVMNDVDRLKADIQKIDPNDLILQQILVADAANLADKEEIMTPILNSADFKKLSPGSNAAFKKAAEEIFTNQVDSLVLLPDSIKNVKLLKAGELGKANEVSLEQKERARLMHDILNNVEIVAKVSPDAVKLVKSKKIKPNMLSTKDIIDNQELIKLMLNKPGDIDKIIKGSSPEDIANLIACMCDLASKIKPLSLKDKQKLQELIELGIADSTTPEIGGVRPSSIFNETIQIPENMFNSKILEAKVPSLTEALNQLVQAASLVGPKVSELGALPKDKVKDMLVRDVDLSLGICDHLLEANNTEYSPDVNTLVEVSPEIVAGLSCVMPSIDKNARQELPSDPASIISQVADIQKNAIDLGNPEKAKNYRKVVIDLQRVLKKVRSALTNDASDPIACAANIIEAAKLNNYNGVNSAIDDYEAAKVSALATGRGRRQIEKLEDIIKGITPTVVNATSTPTGTKLPSLAPLKDALPQLNKFITKEAPNPFDDIEKLNNMQKINESVGITLPKIDLDADSVTRRITSSHKKGTDDSLGDLIRDMADAQAALLKGFNLKGIESIPSCVNMLGNLNLAMGTLGSILEATKTPSVSPLLLKRCQKTLSRAINQMKEELSNSDKDKDGHKSKLDLKKLDFMKDAITTVQSMLGTLSARASAKTPENFNVLFQKKLPMIQTSIDGLKVSGGNLVKACGNKASNADFNKEFENLLGTFANFNKAVGDTEKADIADIANAFIDVSINLASAVAALSRMSDKAGDAPDLVNSERLPGRFCLPPLPTNVSDYNPPDLNKEIQQLIGDYKTALEDFKKKTLSSGSSNAEAAELANDLVDKLRFICIKLLTITALSPNYDLQDKMAKNLNQMVLQINYIIRTLRSKFLLSCPDFNEKQPKIVGNLVGTCDKTADIAKKISEEYAANEEFKKLFGLKFAKVLTPLKASMNAISSDIDISKSLPKGPQKEWSENMLQIGDKLGGACMKVFIYLKEHPSKKMKPDSILDFATCLNNELESMDSHAQQLYAKNGEPEQHCIDSCRAISKLGKKFTDSVIGIDIPGLKDTVISICKAADKTADNADAALKKRVKKGAVIAGAITSVKKMSEDDLMKRLILESKVIKARLYLGRFEKKLSSLQ